MRFASILCLVIVGLLVMPSSTFAMTLALKGGANNASIEYDGPSSEDFRPTMHFGGGVGFCAHINSVFAFDIDFLYVRKGAKYTLETTDSDGSDYTYESTTRWDYAVISPMLRITPFESRIAPFFTVSGEFGRYLSGEASWESNSGGEQDAGTADQKEAVRDQDYSVCFGGGLAFSGDAATLFIETRYVLGLANISQGSDDDVDIQQHTRGLYAFAGVRFN